MRAIGSQNRWVPWLIMAFAGVTGHAADPSTSYCADESGKKWTAECQVPIFLVEPDTQFLVGPRDIVYSAEQGNKADRLRKPGDRLHLCAYTPEGEPVAAGPVVEKLQAWVRKSASHVEWSQDPEADDLIAFITFGSIEPDADGEMPSKASKALAKLERSADPSPDLSDVRGIWSSFQQGYAHHVAMAVVKRTGKKKRRVLWSGCALLGDFEASELGATEEEAATLLRQMVDGLAARIWDEGAWVRDSTTGELRDLSDSP